MRPIEKSVGEGGTGDAGSDDKSVYSLREVRGGSVVVEVRGWVLPVGYCRIGSGETRSDRSPLFHGGVSLTGGMPQYTAIRCRKR